MKKHGTSWDALERRLYDAQPLTSTETRRASVAFELRRMAPGSETARAMLAEVVDDAERRGRIHAMARKLATL